MNDIRVDERWGGSPIENIHGDVSYEQKPFKVYAEYEPAGDQAQAIEKLAQGLKDGDTFQTLKGVTGSGKTYTMAKIIEQVMG